MVSKEVGEMAVGAAGKVDEVGAVVRREVSWYQEAKVVGKAAAVMAVEFLAGVRVVVMTGRAIAGRATLVAQRAVGTQAVAKVRVRAAGVVGDRMGGWAVAARVEVGVEVVAMGRAHRDSSLHSCSQGE